MPSFSDVAEITDDPFSIIPLDKPKILHSHNVAVIDVSQN
jgi:hypothetical protein